MKYKIILHGNCGYPQNPPNWKTTYGRCINWVNAQSQDWKYTVVPENYFVYSVEKIQFLIVNENKFAFHFPQSSSLSILSGGQENPISSLQSNIRLATRKDFDTYRVGIEQYENQSEYEIPLN